MPSCRDCTAPSASSTYDYPSTHAQDTREGYPYHGRNAAIGGALVHGTDTPRGCPAVGMGMGIGITWELAICQWNIVNTFWIIIAIRAIMGR